MNHHTEKDFLPWKKKEITITDNNNKDFLSGFVKGHSAVKSIYTVTSISCEEHGIKATPIFTPLASKISMETFFPPFFLSYFNLQRTRQGQSLHWKPLSLCTSDIRVSSPPESHNLDTFLGNCLEFYLPAVKVSERLLSLLDYRCCVWISSPPSFQPAFHLRTQLTCCRGSEQTQNTESCPKPPLPEKTEHINQILLHQPICGKPCWSLN